MSNQATKLSLWQSVNNELKNLFPPDTYELWFSGLTCKEETDSKIVLNTDNEFNAIWIENNYLDLISKLVSSFSGCRVNVVIDASKKPFADSSSATPEKSSENRTAPGSPSLEIVAKNRPKEGNSNTGCTLLNPKNTFNNFIVGSGNQLSHAASIAVANAPGRAYNPLFVYGETGLGKTHLMHAVAHQLLSNNPNARIAYVSTEKFTNEFIHAIRESKLTKFRKCYRNIDVLLIDDIHFLAGKESTQEEFFHTFNDLFESGRQIFLVSDRPANEIERLENRLVSRFQWGLVTDIQAPDFETRLAILRNKAASMSISLRPEIINFLAERVSRNVRRMEGALIRIASYNSLIDKSLSLEEVGRLLSDLIHEENLTKVTIDQIQKKVSAYYHIRLSELVGRRRTSDIVFPRQVAMYISRTLTSDPLKLIGDAFGGRDHGTVIHACKQVENMMEQDGSVKRGIDYLIKQLTQANES